MASGKPGHKLNNAARRNRARYRLKGRRVKNKARKARKEAKKREKREAKKAAKKNETKKKNEILELAGNRCDFIPNMVMG